MLPCNHVHTEQDARGKRAHELRGIGAHMLFSQLTRLAPFPSRLFSPESGDLEAAAFDEAMHQMGQRPDLDESGATLGGGGGKSGDFEDVGEGGDEDMDPTDALLDWAGQLSFENYHEMWERTAATVVDLG
jgi:hypothetical protein